MKTWVLLGTLVLVILFVPLSLPTAPEPTASAVDGDTDSQPDPHVASTTRPEANLWNGRGLTMQGGAARARLSDLVRRDPLLQSAFDRSRQSLAARGYQETDVAITHFEARRDAPARHMPLSEILVPPLIAQTSQISDWEGAVTYVSWDDGDDQTWEGTILIEDFTDDSWILHEAQNDITTDETRVLWTHERERQPPRREADGLWRPHTPHLYRAANWDCGCGVSSSFCWFGNMYQCEAEQCYNALLGGGGCIASGRLWPMCFAAQCAGGRLSCAITYFKQRKGRCGWTG